MVKKMEQNLKPNVKPDPFLVVARDFELSLKQIWSALPQETLIAACLDHRFKSLKHIPMEEHEEAWKCVEVEYSCPEFFYLQNKKEQLPPEEKSPPKKKSKADPMAIFEEPIDTCSCTNCQNISCYSCITSNNRKIILSCWKNLL